LDKKDIISNFLISKINEGLFQEYIDRLQDYNSHTNIVGKSTLVNPWSSHVLDCIQILPFIKNKKLSILDMGTGAGLPGIVLYISGCNNVTLIDSNGKKINFLKLIKKKMNLNINIILGRLEKLNNLKFDVITSRALASLDKLLSYSQKFMKKSTVLIFLKGKTVNEELKEAQKKWTFYFQKHKSISDSRGNLMIIKSLKKK
jgi:16S rRNA (guanine527-N7)-methyltransferase